MVLQHNKCPDAAPDVLRLCISRRFATAIPTPSERVLHVAAMFGLGLDTQRDLTIVPPCEIPIPLSGGIVFITGPSGAGKSTILKLIGDQWRQTGRPLICFDQLPDAPDAPLIDALGSTFEQAAELLSLAGLGDAYVMLRRPAELSDGQRYRFNLARMFELARSKACSATGTTLVLADEFAATLDRITAKTIARHVRRLSRHRATVFIVATTHDDLLEDLSPDVLVWKGPGDQIEVVMR